MLRIMLSGCNGRMGRVITRLCAGTASAAIVCGLDLNLEQTAAFPVYSDPFEFDAKADVLIDFSNVSALPRLLSYCEQTETPLVLATTGLDAALENRVLELSSKIPVFKSGNMSIGINLMIDLIKKAARVLYDTADIEIIERHHNQKLDAPSGTALMLADAMRDEISEPRNLVYDRHNERKKRESCEIGMHSVRGGTIVGEHEVVFAWHDEVLTVTHSSLSREILAAGALRAAHFIVGKDPSMYNMSDIISL